MDCLFPTLDFSRHQSPPPLVLVRVIIKSLVLVSLSRKNRPLCSGGALGEGEKWRSIFVGSSVVSIVN